MANNSFSTECTLSANGQDYAIHDLMRLPNAAHVAQLPFSLKILLENLLRNEDGREITRDHIQALSEWTPENTEPQQIAFTPARVVLQDFTGVPAIVDLAAMRDAMVQLGGDPQAINPSLPVDLVIDHSVMVDYSGSDTALQNNTELEFSRNRERYEFLRWGQKAFDNFRVVPPGTGIVHQVNLEYLAQVVTSAKRDGKQYLFPDTLVGTDSHTTMINGLGVLGWGVGGIEAEAAMLGLPISMLTPEVVGFEIAGVLPEGTTATDLVLTITQQLREHGVVGKFVEFYGDGLSQLPLADRATIANMAPEYGATCGIFPIDQETLNYLRLSGRDEQHIRLVEAYAKSQKLWREDGARPARYNATLELDLATVEPSIAGPRRPQDRVLLRDAPLAFARYLQDYLDRQSDKSLEKFADEGGNTAVGSSEPPAGVTVDYGDEQGMLKNGDVVIAAITSCTNTSNPAVMIAAGLVAKKAVEHGLKVPRWVKTSLAPGSQVVPAYLEKAGLLADLEQLGFNVVGFGCTTCIGNSGPLPDAVSEAINQGDLTVCSVLSGNRNFEGRIHSDVRANYLASPPLVVAYALAGNMNVNLWSDPIAENDKGEPVYLKDLWPSNKEVGEVISETVAASLYQSRYQDVFEGSAQWRGLKAPSQATYDWPESGYIKKPPFFDGIAAAAPEIEDIKEARCLAMLGDSTTTDHISPAGSIHPKSPAGRYLQEQNVTPENFNSLGSRRGNHEVMMRGTFANPRIRNLMLPGTEGGLTRHFPSKKTGAIYDVAMLYREDKTPLVVIAGREYGTGSSRDWAAKGTRLLGVRVVLAESFERIHRTNLVGFGVLPLQFEMGDSAEKLGLTGEEVFSFSSIQGQPKVVTVHAKRPSGETVSFDTRVCINTPREWDYFYNGGILHFALRQKAAS